eukprot:4767898-Pleurochrysis_carterae.AAC.1
MCAHMRRRRQSQIATKAQRRSSALFRVLAIAEICRSPKSSLTKENTCSHDAEFGEIEITICAAFRYSDSSSKFVDRQNARMPE